MNGGAVVARREILVYRNQASFNVGHTLFARIIRADLLLELLPCTFGGLVLSVVVGVHAFGPADGQGARRAEILALQDVVLEFGRRPAFIYRLDYQLSQVLACRVRNSPLGIGIVDDLSLVCDALAHQLRAALPRHLPRLIKDFGPYIAVFCNAAVGQELCGASYRIGFKVGRNLGDQVAPVDDYVNCALIFWLLLRSLRQFIDGERRRGLLAFALQVDR